MSGDRRAVGGEHGPSAVELLPRFKRDGCNLLVSGTVSESTANRASRRLLGSPDLDRKRVLVPTGGPGSVDGLLPPGVSTDDRSVSVVQHRTPSDDGDGGDSLATLSRRVTEAVTAFDSLSPPLVGGELRLVVTSLDALLADHDVRATERFLRSVTGVVSSVRGMGHYRYPGPRADLSSLPTERLFDAFVDLRDTPATEQRLSIPPSRSTDWLDL
jgi:hypothetical protein